MRRNKTSLVRVVLAAVAVTVACADRPDPAAPVDAPSYSVAPGQKGKAMRRTSPQASDATVTQTVGPEGGTLSVAGVTLRVPKRALREDVEITMTVPAGEFMQVQFEPHGLSFERAATLSFDASGADHRELRTAGGAYFESQLSAAGDVDVKEAYNVRVNGNGVVWFEISHFSGYCVITNRCGCES